MATGGVSWLEFGALAVNGSVSWIEFAPEPSTGSVSWIEFAPEPSTGSVSWIEFASSPPLDANCNASDDADSLLSAASTAAVYGSVSWIEFFYNIEQLAFVAATEEVDLLSAHASGVDPQVSGSWTPALKSRWVVLDSAPLVPELTANATSLDDDFHASSCVAILVASATSVDDVDMLLTAVFNGDIPPDRSCSLAATDEIDLQMAWAVSVTASDPVFLYSPHRDADLFSPHRDADLFSPARPDATT